MLKLFKNWFTITNTNNMRREKIFKNLLSCVLCLWVGCLHLKTMPTYAIQFLGDMSIFFSFVSNISSLHAIIHLNHEKYHSLILCSDIGSVSGTV